MGLWGSWDMGVMGVVEVSGDPKDRHLAEQTVSDRSSPPFSEFRPDNSLIPSSGILLNMIGQ